MRRLGPIVVVAVSAIALAVTGCARNANLPPLTPTTETPVTGTPAATTEPPGPSGPATATATPFEFTVDGAGPYQLGAKLADLQAAGQLAEVATGGEVCPANTTARGTPPWQDIRLSFRPDGTLYLVVNRSGSIPTPSGAWLGDTPAQVKAIYKDLAQDLSQGAAKAILVATISGRGILFDFGTTGKVFAMAAGDSIYLKSSYQGGTDFC